jgi:DNA-binding XRE family transcriptional regulator
MMVAPEEVVTVDFDRMELRRGDSDDPVDEKDDLDLLLEEELVDPAFRALYEDSEHRADLLRSLVSSRSSAHLTQEMVAQRMGTTQSAVSELEGGTSDPRFSTLQRYARAVNHRICAWSVPEESGADAIFGAFIDHQGRALVGQNHYSACRYDMGVNLEVVAMAASPSHLGSSSIYFAGKLSPTDAESSSELDSATLIEIKSAV